MTDFDLRYSVLRRSLIEREFESLNDMQQKAVFKTEGPLLLLAGAGSGKTTVLINRIINLLRFGAGYESDGAPAWAGDAELARLALALAEPDALSTEELDRLCAVNPPRPYEIIAITFTNKAAGELKERLNLACGPSAGDIWAHTFHSACTRILRRDIEKLGYPKSFTIYDEDDKKKMLTSIIKDLGYDEKKYEVRPVSFEISRSKDALITAAEYAENAGSDHYRKVVARIYAAYESRMLSAGALDFDDIIVRTVQLLRDFPEVREHYQRKFKYVLVDEYQDTNHAQYMLCSLLAGGYGNICVVGDDDQSIYKFRGATIANILEFEQQYPAAVTIRLEQNYRSTGNILAASNGVIERNLGRKGKKLWTKKDNGEKVIQFSGESQEEEALYIAKRIKTAHAKGDKLNSFAILYRNHALSNNIEIAFQRAGIPYRIVSGLRFFDRAEVKDMLSYLWVVQNPGDSIRLKRIINNPPRKIGAKTIDTVSLLAEQHGISEFEVIGRASDYPELSRGAASLQAFHDMLTDLIAKKDTLPLTDYYDYALDHSGYLPHLRLKEDEETARRIENVLELKSNIADYCAKNEDASLQGFLEEIALVSDIDRYDEETDTVTMMTMHSAKGLEFDTVFLVGAEEGLFPSYRSLESEEEIEEERRLCYVAMTRARKQLYITCAKRRMLYGQTSYAKPSRFTEEIPEEYLEKDELRQTPAHSNVRPNFARAQKEEKERNFRRSSFVSAAPSAGSAPTASFRVGDAVRHKSFGEGVVRDMTPMGGDVLLNIEFKSCGVKLMMLKTAGQFITKA